MEQPTVRMFVDENGHQALKGDLSLPDRRFLCLTGVIMPIDEHDNTLTPRLNALKSKYFGDTNIVLHRREIINGTGNFASLQDSDVRAEYNKEFLSIVSEVKYRVISVVIDKMTLYNMYGHRAQDPYGLALEYLMQRYLYWLQAADFKGDILAESRGGGEDIVTKRTYNDIYLGKGFISLENASRYLTSSQIKLKKKSDNIAGLQFVDLISHPARRFILAKNGLSVNTKKSSYEEQIVRILIDRKFRRKDGSIEGCGVVLYPKTKTIR